MGVTAIDPYGLEGFQLQFFRSFPEPLSLRLRQVEDNVLLHFKEKTLSFIDLIFHFD
jgi:hypothetical protein